MPQRHSVALEVGLGVIPACNRLSHRGSVYNCDKEKWTDFYDDNSRRGQSVCNLQDAAAMRDHHEYQPIWVA